MRDEIYARQQGASPMSDKKAADSKAGTKPTPNRAPPQRTLTPLEKAVMSRKSAMEDEGDYSSSEWTGKDWKMTGNGISDKGLANQMINQALQSCNPTTVTQSRTTSRSSSSILRLFWNRRFATGRNTFRYPKKTGSGGTWKVITLPNGMYDYSNTSDCV